MASAMLTFGIVTSAALLVGYALTRPKPRRAKASRDSSSFGDAGYDSGDTGSHHGWGGHGDASGHSVGSADGGASGGGGDGGSDGGGSSDGGGGGSD
jgi:hypothetical protein